MDKKQFIKQYTLVRISDRELLLSIDKTSWDSTVVDVLSEFMSKVPIELYKHAFETGTTFYVSINNINKKIICEFFFDEDQHMIDIFNFIKNNLNSDFVVQSAFNEVDFISKYTDQCLDKYNDNKITLDQMNDFLMKFTNFNTTNIINYGHSMIRCLNENKMSILNSINDDLFSGGIL